MDQSLLRDLVFSLGHGDSSTRSKLLRSLSPDEWRAFFSFAHQQGVAPLLYHRLKSQGIPPPDDVAKDLRETFLWNTARNMCLYQELKEFLPVLIGDNVPVIVLKGAYLAEKVYEDIGLRGVGDIDLLIPESEVEKAVRIVIGLGFTPMREFRQDVDGLLHYHAPPMEKNGVPVELHWDLTLESNLSSINTKDLWERAERIQLQDVDVQALSLTDLLLHVAVHASYHHRFHYQLRSLCDIEEILFKHEKEVNWPLITRICHEWQAERGTYLTLRLVTCLFGTRIPVKVLENLIPVDWTEEMLDWALVSLFQTHPVLSENFIQLMHGTRPGERIAALLKALFPSRAVMAMIYGYPPRSWRIIALYPKHVATRLSKYWGHTRNLIHGDQTQVRESESDLSLRQWLGIK